MSLYDEMETLRNGTKKTSLFDELENRRNGIDIRGEVNTSPSLSIKEPGIDYAALKNNADYGKYSSYDYKGKLTDVFTQPFVKELNLANAARNAKNGQINSTFSPEELKPYLHMTDEQYATMNYLANNPNYGARASYDYLRSLSQDLNKAAADVDIQKAQDFAEAHPVLGTVASVGANLSAGVHALDADATKAVRDFAYGYNPSLDVYDQGHRASYVSDAMTEKVTEGIDSNVGKFLYGTGTSMLNSAAQMALFGPFSTVIMGTNAFASRERELKDMGASDTQAFIGGALSGAIEYLTEKVSVEHFLKAKNFNSFGTWMKETLKQMFAEGSEEFFSDVLNTAVDHLAYAMGGVSDYENWKKQYAANGGDEQTMFANYAWSKAKDIGLSFLGGAISGGVMGNVSNAMNYGKQLKTGSNIIKSGRVQDLMDQAAMSGHEDFARLLENPTKTNVGYVQNELLREASEKANAKKASAEDKAKFTEKIVDYVTNQTSKTGVADKEGNAVHIESLSLEGDEIVINAEEGKFKLNEVDKTEAIQTAMESTDGLNENAKKAFIENYEPGENLKAYSDRFDLVYTYGLTDNMEGMEKFLSETTMESENAMRIFKAGMRDKGAYTAIKEEQIKQRAILKETFGNVAKSGKMDASIISFDGDVKGKVNFEKLDDNKKSQFMAVSAIKDKLGLNITWFNSEGRKRGDKFYSNGFYDPSNNTIYLDINATNSGTGNKNNTGAIITALSHELVHWAEAKSPELYSKLRAKILDTQLKANEGLTRGLLIEGIRSAEEYAELSDKEAIDEVMARSLENALSNTQLMEEITSDMTMAEKADFWTKVKDFFKDLANSLKSLLKRFDSQSTYAKLIERDVKTYNEIVDMYDAMLRDASEVTAAYDEFVKVEKTEIAKYSVKTDFGTNLKNWLSTNPQFGYGFFETGETSDVLKSIGVPDYVIKIGRQKIIDILKKHPDIDDNVIANIPYLLENPIIVLQSNTEPDSLVILGDLYDANNIPVMASLKVVSKGANGVIDDFGIITSGYSRTIAQYQNFLNRDDIYYIDSNKNRTNSWLSAFRLQLPSSIHQYGSIKMIPQALKYVKEMDSKYLSFVKSGKLNEARKMIAEKAKKQGGVLNKSGNSYIFSAVNQVKSADTVTYDDNGEIIPLSERFNLNDPDIRYSAKDSEGKNLTENQADYFKDSAIRDKDGKLKVMYHGTNADFTVFNPFVSGGKNGVAEGYGLYFSDSPDVSDKYGSKVMKGYLNIKNPASKFERKISKSSLAKLIKATCEKEAKVMLEDGYESVSDAVKDTWISNYVNTYEIPIADAYKRVASEIMQRNENDFDAIQEVMSGMGIRSYDQAYDFYDTLTETIGVDGFVTEWTDTNTDEKTEIALAFNSNQFKNVDNLNPTSNPDIRYSTKDSEGNELTEAQQKFFENSKVRDDKGNLKLMYHGTKAKGFTVFDISKAKSGGTYGKGFYFSDSEGHSATYGQRYKVYLNIENPMQLGTRNITKNQLKEFVKAIAENEDYGIDNYGQYATVDSVVSQLWGKSDFAIVNDLNISCVGNFVEALKLFNEVNGTNYDGIIAPTETVAFYPEQIKLTTNENPTSDPDIRYSYKDNGRVNSGTFFSGGGTVDYALRKILDHQFGVEFNENISMVYRDNLGDHIFNGDVRDFATEKHRGNIEYFHASPVCKDYSKAKNNGGELPLDLETARATAKAIRELNPQVVTVENVVGYNGSNAMKLITDALDEMGYTWDVDTYNSADYGAYTSRERLIIRAVAEGELPPKPKKQTRKSGWYEVVADIMPTLKESEAPNWMIQRLEKMGIDYKNPKEPLFVFGNGESNKEVRYAYASQLIPTIKANDSPNYIFMPDGRVLKDNPRFLARITGLDDDYKLPKQATLARTVIGNGIPVKLTQSVMGGLLKDQFPNIDARFSYKDSEGYIHLEAGEELSLEEITSYLAENASNIAVREEYSKLKKQVESIAKGEIKGAKDLSKYADSLLKDNGSKYDKSKLVEMLVEIQKNAKEGKNIERDCKSLAHFILANSSRMTVDKSLEKDLRNIREELRGYKLKLSENQKKEMRYTFGAEWTTVLLGKVKLSNTEGITLDEMWSTLSSEYPFLLETDVTDADQGVQLADLVKYLYSDKSYMFKWSESEERERTEALGREIAHQLTVNSNKEVKEQRDPIEAKARYDKAVLDYIADQREKFAKLKEQYNERTVKRNLRERIINKATRMNEKLVKNDKDNHIPEVLKQPLLNVLNALQLQNHGNESIARKFTNLADALEEVMTTSQAEENLNGYFDSNSYFVQNIRMIVSELNANMDNFSNKLNGEKSFKLMDLSVDGLRAFNDVLTAINRAAYNYDQALSGDTKLRISERGASTRQYLKDIGDKKTDKIPLIANIKGFLNWDNVTQIYAFDRFGEGGKTTFKGIMEGQDKLALNTKQIVDYCNDTFSGQEYYDWSNENHEVEIGGHKYDVTTTQLMSLYALYKRKSSHQHLFTTTNAEGDVIEGQGIVLVSNEDTDSKYYQVRTTEADIKSLIGLLTDRQKAVADKLQNFMNTVCSDWGNYVTMKRFGILQFGEENYFPMQVFGDNKMTELRDKPEGASLYSLLNQSFTKSLNNKANGALELHDFFSVFLSHANGMATYNAMGLPVLDVLKWMNYTEDNYGVKESVQTWIRDAYGTRATSWLKQYLVDINGNRQSRTDLQKVADKIITNYKTAAVAANLRVALMQPTAYIKASIYIDPKYLVKAFSANPKTLKAYIAEMNEKAPLGLWKTELGMFDLNIGRSTAAKALQTDKVNTGKFKDKANAIREKAMDLFMKPAEIGDSITWGALYHACKLEIMDTQHLEGAELDKAVNEKFREMCFRTQVFDSINARSQLMRSKDGMAKLWTAFASEPTLSYSMLSNEAFMYAMEAKTDKAKAWKNHGKKIGKTALAWALCELAVSMVAGIPDFIRDDDETEDIGDIIKTYFKKVFGNYSSDLIMLPYLRDIQSVVINGYDPSRPDEEIFNDIGKIFNMTKKSTEGKSPSPYKWVYNVTKVISHLTGIPLSNVVRGAKSIINKTIVEWMGWDKIE